MLFLPRTRKMNMSLRAERESVRGFAPHAFFMYEPTQREQVPTASDEELKVSYQEGLAVHLISSYPCVTVLYLHIF